MKRYGPDRTNLWPSKMRTSALQLRPKFWRAKTASREDDPCTQSPIGVSHEKSGRNRPANPHTGTNSRIIVPLSSHGWSRRKIVDSEFLASALSLAFTVQ